MIGGAASLLLALGLGGAAVPVADFDIPYFLANPKVHEEMLRRCHNDERLAMTLECENAERAGTRRIGRPLPRNFGKDFGKIPSTKQPPLPRGKERGA
ncbi:hypothetical protein SAE02_63070 [Skermanella aerolata]|uniref:Uncharacterized protein n=1 Tax=Skermanella aerolata TaxID=393310 RepID=A0A512E0F2_9PROT|nr:hypothetical protein [Skermanella aerolata]KJB91345.1 hypothetical protein N826_30760 [Skermanella aerolata KACC 11604]GEO42159.1 hypothetical protein SAE02_63070 [Skermanella aerolata]